MKAIELFEEKKYDELLTYFESLPPREFSDRFILLENIEQKKGVNVIEILYSEWTEEQWKLFDWLDSSDRMRKYILAKKEEDLTDQDIFDLRACDF